MTTPELLFETMAPLTGHNTVWSLQDNGHTIDVRLDHGTRVLSIDNLDTGRQFKITSERGRAIVALVLAAYHARFGDGLDAEEDHPKEAVPQLTPAGEAVSKQMLLAGRNHGPRILVDALLDQRVPEDDLPVLVADAWTMAEYPTRCEEPHVWESLFRRIGYRNAAGDQIERPDKIVLYRGASVLELEEDSFGMSWTTSREQAVWFATEYFARTGDNRVYRCDVPGEDLLADYRDADRDESEIVVRGDRLDPSTVHIEVLAELEGVSL